MIGTQEVMICNDIQEMVRRAAVQFVEMAGKAISERGFFTVALSGGSTPEPFYRLLAAKDFREKIDWRKVHFFWGDERCVPPTHRESNYRMASDALFSKLDLPEENIHRIKGESGLAAATEYQEEIRRFFHLRSKELPVFDLILLGMGEDGHIASLFPGDPALKEREKPVAAVPLEALLSRITLTPPVIQKARNIMVLVSGRRKAEPLWQGLKGTMPPEKAPVRLLHKAQGKVIWLADREAAGRLGP